MASHQCGRDSLRTMILQKNKTNASTIMLSLMMMTAFGINDQVACWPMMESPPSWPTSSSPPPSSSLTSSTFISASEELDSDASRKVLGSSVVTSVSVVMNNSDGKSNSSTRPAGESTMAISDSAFSTSSVSSTPVIPAIKTSSLDDNSRMDNSQLKDNLIASPGNLLNPDKYEFYTFDESGDLVKKLMSWDEIQGLIAASDTDGLLGEAVVPIYYNENPNTNANANAYIAIADKLHGTHLTANEFQTSDVQDVRKVVESVQNVLKHELAAAATSQSKIILPAAAKPSLHSNSPNWSSLFMPNFLDNLDEDAFVDLQHHHHLSSDNTLTITSPIQNSAQPFDKMANQTTENRTSAAITSTTLAADNSSSSIQTKTTPAVPALSTTTIDSNNSKKHSYVTQSNNLTSKTSATLPPSPSKFTRIKNTAAKPTNFKYSSSATSEKVWSLPNSIVLDEKPTKNFIVHSSSSSTPSSPSSPMSTSSPVSWFSTSHLPSSPIKSFWSTKTSPTGTFAAAMTPASVAGTSKTTSVMFTNGNSVASQALFNPFSQDQQQMAKIKPGSDSFIYESSSKMTTVAAKHQYTSHYGQRNNSTLTSATVPVVDREKINLHHQLSSLLLNNSTDRLQMVTLTSPLPSTSYNVNTNNSTSDLPTKTTTNQYQNSENVPLSLVSASGTLSQSTLSYKQSTSTNNPNPPSWKINGINGGVPSSMPPITSTAGKLNSFTPFRTTATMSGANINNNVMTETPVTRTTPSTYNVFSHHNLTSHWPVKIRGNEGQSTTTAEPLVTWISTNDDRIKNKISYNGQILDSDKLVTEQYVSGTAPGPSTMLIANEQLNLFSKDTNLKNSSNERLPSSPSFFTTNTLESFKKKTTFTDDNSSKTTYNTDFIKKHSTTLSLATATTSMSTPLSHQSPLSSYHTWLSSATTSEQTPSSVHQPMVPNRINTIHNGASGGYVESKTVITPTSNNHHLHHNSHIHHHYNHHHDQPQQQHPIPIRNTPVTFSSFYHRDRPASSSSSSGTTADSNVVKYTKTPSSSLINATTSNEMVMQRIPTLDPPNKVASPSSSSFTAEGNDNDVFGTSMNSVINMTTQHHSSTESAKNLTQIAIMVNKSNDTMTKNSYNKNTVELKYRPSTKPNHFFDSLISNTPSTNKKYTTNSDKNKTHSTVKPINSEFLKDCITSSISNSVVTEGSGGGNNREPETAQSLSYNDKVGNVDASNASHNNHYHHNLHNYNYDNTFNDRNGDDYRLTSTAVNYITSVLLSQDQNKYNSSSTSTMYGSTHPANTWDTYQQKVTLPSTSVATGEKLKENSHIYYYKLPPINSQPLKANANMITSSIYSSASTAAVTGSSYSSTTGTVMAATTATTVARPTSMAADKTYQKITTVNRPSSSMITSSTNSQSSLHTEARISSSSNSINKASTIPIQDTITSNSADSSIAAEVENREASASTIFHQIVSTKSSESDLQDTNAVMRYENNGTSGNTSLVNQDKLKTTSSNSNDVSTRHTEPIATPQVVTVSLNFSTATDTASLLPTTPISVAESSDLRKDDISQDNDVDSVAIAISKDDDDDDEDIDENDDVDDNDSDGNEGYGGNSGENDDGENNGGYSNNLPNSVKESAVEDSEKNNHENDYRHKAEQDALVNKNQRVANSTTAQFWPARYKTTLVESSFKDRTRNNAANKTLTTNFSQERFETKTTLPTLSWSPPQKNSYVSGTTFRSGDVNSTSSSTITMNTTFGNVGGSSSAAVTAATTNNVLGSTPSIDNDGGFVRVKLENRTTQSSQYDSATMSTSINNKQKEDKIKVTLGKNQPPSKQSGVSGASTIAAPVTNTNLPLSPTPSPVTSSINIFRSPGVAPTQSWLSSGLPSSNTAAIQIVTSTTATWTTNGNGNAASAAVELHPAPHENMGLEASIAYLGDDVKTFIDLCNELSFKIWTTQTGKSLTTSRSIVLSPFALLSTLAMIFLGARGSSSGIMNDFLRLDDMVTFNPHQVFRNITESAVNSKNNGAANVAFVRQVFSDKTKGNVLEFYKERLQQYYDTYVEEINFSAVGDLVRRRTNLLVKRQTQGRIQDYLRGLKIAMKPPLATFTANIFQTDCSTASTEGRDGEMYFVVRPSTRQRRLVPIPAVVYRSGFLAGYEPGLDATAVTLSPESVISTILVLPGQQGQVAPGDGLARLEQRLLESSYRRGAWSRLLRSLLFRHGLEVQIPRFSHKSILNLTMGLQRMGMGEIFAPDKADLRGINGLLNELHLSDCVQANTFSTCGEESVGARHHIETFPSLAQRTGTGREVDEEIDSDQEALSTTMSSLLNLRPRQARLPDNPRLRFDRPFLYIVRHNPTGMILYIGRFNPRLLP